MVAMTEENVGLDRKKKNRNRKIESNRIQIKFLDFYDVRNRLRTKNKDSIFLLKNTLKKQCSRLPNPTWPCMGFFTQQKQTWLLWRRSAWICNIE